MIRYAELQPSTDQLVSDPTYVVLLSLCSHPIRLRAEQPINNETSDANHLQLLLRNRSARRLCRKACLNTFVSSHLHVPYDYA